MAGRIQRDTETGKRATSFTMTTALAASESGVSSVVVEYFSSFGYR